MNFVYYHRLNMLFSSILSLTHNWSFNQEKGRVAFPKMTIIDELPLNLVKSKGSIVL